MTATERLRLMLDERGVEYTQTIETEGVLFTIVTSKEHYFILMRDNDAGIKMWSQYFTPEQAIAATLGAGMCYVVCSDDYSYMPPTWHLSCGHTVQGNERPSYCSNCGKRVVTDG